MALAETITMACFSQTVLFCRGTQTCVHDTAGRAWRRLEAPEGIWERLEASEGVWGRLEASGGAWRRLEAPGRVWRRLEASGRVWRRLEASKWVRLGAPAGALECAR